MGRLRSLFRHRRPRLVLLRLRPVKDPRSIVLIDWRADALADGWDSGNLMFYPMCRDRQAQRQFFDGVLLAVVALAAAMVPAWRASSVSPTKALYAE